MVLTHYALDPVNAWELVRRLSLRRLVGGAIGFERELKRKAAGLRTNMLVCFGAAIAAAIWVSATLGVTIACGMVELGFAGGVVTGLVLRVVGIVERRWIVPRARQIEARRHLSAIAGGLILTLNNLARHAKKSC